MIPLDHDLISLFEHDLFGKPVPTFPDHAPDAENTDFYRLSDGRLDGKGATE